MFKEYKYTAGNRSFSVVHVRGTHYHVGYETGRLLQDRIKQYYENSEFVHQYGLPFIRTPDGGQVYNDFLDTASKVFPQYLEELRGYAEACAVPFEQVLLTQIYPEIDTLLRQRKDRSSFGSNAEPPMRCSTLLLNRPNCQYLGHNEDEDPSRRDDSFLISAEVISEDGQIVEKFTAFAYPDMLPGSAFGFNHHGLILTVNSLVPSKIIPGKIPISFLNRTLLAAKDLTEVERLLNMAPGLSLGYNLNVVVPGPPAGWFEMYNYELVGNISSSNDSTIIDKLQLQPFDEKRKLRSNGHLGNGFLYHFNKYERLKVNDAKEYLHSSIHRCQRASDFPAPRIRADVLAFLGDTRDRNYPIYRSAEGKDGGCTIMTALFNLQNMTMSVYLDNPKLCQPLLTVPLPARGGNPVN